MSEVLELPPQETPEKHHKRILMLLVKLGFTAGLFYLVFTRIESAELLTKLKGLPLHYVLLSFLFLNAMQLISAARTRYYFRCSGHAFSFRFAAALYYTGALFNIILPGGISGDGYKAWFLKKHRAIPVAMALRRILSERANGLLFLLLYAILLVMMTPAAEKLPGGRLMLIAALPVLVVSYFICIRVFLKEEWRTAIGACRFSAPGQACVMLSALPIFLGLGISGEILADYIALFMFSCVVAILPISVGGAGVREATFFYGGPVLGLDPELGVAAGLAFFAVHVMTSMVGLLALRPLRKMAEEKI